MMSFRTPFAAAALALAATAAPAFLSPAAAAIDNQQPGPFIESLTADGLGVLRGGNRVAAKAQFRALLSQHFAVDQIGDRLIRRWKGQISPAQLAAYKAAFPNFIVGTYADRLFDYANARVKVIRAVPQGTSAAVQTQVAKPGAAPINAVWTVDRIGNGYKVTNLTVAGVNLAITQAADFDAIVQRRGFDALVQMMKSRG